MKRRNWTSEETKLFCEILVDPVNNLIVTLKKESAQRQVFKCPLTEMRRGLEEPSFKGKSSYFL